MDLDERGPPLDPRSSRSSSRPPSPATRSGTTRRSASRRRLSRSTSAGRSDDTRRPRRAATTTSSSGGNVAAGKTVVRLERLRRVSHVPAAGSSGDDRPEPRHRAGDRTRRPTATWRSPRSSSESIVDPSAYIAKGTATRIDAGELRHEPEAGADRRPRRLHPFRHEVAASLDRGNRVAREYITLRCTLSRAARTPSR